MDSATAAAYDGFTVGELFPDFLYSYSSNSTQLFITAAAATAVVAAVAVGLYLYDLFTNGTPGGSGGYGSTRAGVYYSDHSTAFSPESGVKKTRRYVT